MCLGILKFVNALPASVFAQALERSQNVVLVEMDAAKTGFYCPRKPKMIGQILY